MLVRLKPSPSPECCMSGKLFQGSSVGGWEPVSACLSSRMPSQAGSSLLQDTASVQQWPLCLRPGLHFSGRQQT